MEEGLVRVTMENLLMDIHMIMGTVIAVHILKIMVTLIVVVIHTKKRREVQICRVKFLKKYILNYSKLIGLSNIVSSDIRAVVERGIEIEKDNEKGGSVLETFT